MVRGRPSSLGEGALGFVRSTRPKNARKLRQQRFTRNIINLSRKEKLQEAGDVLVAMQRNRVVPEAATYNALISGHARQGQAREAFKLFNQMKKRGLTPTDHTYSSMFSACAMAGLEGGAVLSKLQSELQRRDVALNLISTNSLLSALARCGSHKETGKVFLEMGERGLAPDVKTYSALLQAASHDQEEGVATAGRVWQEMLGAGVNPDLYSYNLFLHCLRGAGFSGLQRNPPPSPFLLLSLPSDSAPSPPSSRLLSTQHRVAIDYAVRVGLGGGKEIEVCVTTPRPAPLRLLTEGALISLSKAMEGSGVTPDIRCFNLLAALVPDTVALLARMDKAAVAPDNYFMLAAIKNQCRHGNLKGAKALCRYSESLGLALSEGVWPVLAGCCSSQEEGVALLGDIKASGVGVTEAVFAALLRSAAKSRSYEYVTAIMKEMRHSEVSAGPQVLKTLHRLLADPPSERRLKMRFNGFAGYYHLWKRTMT